MPIHELAELLSTHRQLDLVSNGYGNLLKSGENGIVKLHPGVKYTMITVDGSITYYVDKETNEVKDFYKRHRGFVSDLEAQYQQQNQQLRKRIYGSKNEPLLEYVKIKVVGNVKQSEDAQIAAFRAKGKIFVHSWGYDASVNDYVIVVSETPKTVMVQKLQKDVKGNWDNGSSRPIPKPVGPQFQLRKGVIDRGEFVLRGSDKADGSSGYSVTWYEWDGKARAEYNVH
jgi:hypothetical protein